MNNIDVSQIVDPSKQQPFLGTSLEFLQNATKEALMNLYKGFITDTTQLYILYGCQSSVFLGVTIVTAGAIYYNGEIYTVDATAFVISGGQVAICALKVTNPAPDPITFSNGDTGDVHDVRKIEIKSGVSGSGISGDTKSDFTNVLTTFGWTNKAITAPMITLPVGGSPANVTGYFRYKKIGKTILWNLDMNFDVTGTIATAVELDLGSVLTLNTSAAFRGAALEDLALGEFLKMVLPENDSIMTFTRVSGTFAIDSYTIGASGAFDIQ